MYEEGKFPHRNWNTNMLSRPTFSLTIYLTCLPDPCPRWPTAPSEYQMTLQSVDWRMCWTSTTGMMPKINIHCHICNPSDVCLEWAGENRRKSEESTPNNNTLFLWFCSLCEAQPVPESLTLWNSTSDPSHSLCIGMCESFSIASRSFDTKSMPKCLLILVEWTPVFFFCFCFFIGFW